jgi:hypothetical protein
MNRRFAVPLAAVSVLVLGQFLWAGTVCRVVAGVTPNGQCYNGVVCSNGSYSITVGPCLSSNKKLKSGSPQMPGDQLGTLLPPSRWRPSSLDDVINFRDITIERTTLNFDSPENKSLQPAF